MADQPGTSRADAASAWRNRARYERLLGYDKATWAWECLRRALGRELATSCRPTWRLLRTRPPLCVLTVPSCRAYGCVVPLAVIDGMEEFTDHVFWCRHLCGPVLDLDAFPLRRNMADGFDLRTIPYPAVVLRHLDGGEHVLIADGPRCIRVAVRSGTLLDGAVRLAFHLPGDSHVSAKIMTLRRLTALCRLGRFPVTLFPPEHRARRWALALQAWDGRQAGASHRDIARVIHGDAAVRAEWRGASDYMRTHVKRLLRTADTLIDGGWRNLLH